MCCDVCAQTGDVVRARACGCVALCSFTLCRVVLRCVMWCGEVYRYARALAGRAGGGGGRESVDALGARVAFADV